MEIIKGIDEVLPRHRGAVVTIGNFDGVHVGHRKILSAVLAEARRLRTKSMAITFEPHPVRVLAPERELKILTPPQEKARLMGHCGVDMLLFIDFSRDFARISAEEFIKEILAGRLGAKTVIVGHNYSFGRGKRGNTALLRRRGAKYGFGVKVIRSSKFNGDVVSSSRVRSLISWGRVCEAANYLGRPYSITGTVVRGAGRGARLLGIPTANISVKNELVPKEGVYAVRAELDGKLHDGVANIGKNPTFGSNEVSREVHLLDFNSDIRGKDLRVHFIDRIRDERKFPDAKILLYQILKDIGRAREILKARKSPSIIRIR